MAKQVKAGTGGFVTGAAAVDGVVTAIRRAGGSTNGLRLARRAREVQEGAGNLRSRELHSAAALGLRPPVPRAEDRQRKGEARRHDHGVVTRQDLAQERVDGDRRQHRYTVARRLTPGHRRVARLRGGAGARRRHARRQPARGRRADRPERRGQDDARQPPDRVRPADRGHDRARRSRHHALGAAPPRPGRASHARSSTAARFEASRCARTSSSPRSASVPARGSPDSGPTSCSTSSG